MRNQVNVLKSTKPNLRNLAENMEYAIADVMHDIGSMISIGKITVLRRDVKDLTILTEALDILRNKRRSTAGDRVIEAEMVLNDMSANAREMFIEQFNYHQEIY